MQGDIYENSCYFQYDFTADIIDQFQLDVDRLNVYPTLSCTVDDLLPEAASDEKEELVERLHALKLEEKSLTKRICELEKAEHIVKDEKKRIQAVLDWGMDTYSRKGVIGRNQLELICKKHNVQVFDAVRLLEKEGVAIVNYA